eukprot:PhM_4_TR17969/c0_g2_i1/m.76712
MSSNSHNFTNFYLSCAAASAYIASHADPSASKDNLHTTHTRTLPPSALPRLEAHLSPSDVVRQLNAVATAQSCGAVADVFGWVAPSLDAILSIASPDERMYLLRAALRWLETGRHTDYDVDIIVRVVMAVLNASDGAAAPSLLSLLRGGDLLPPAVCAVVLTHMVEVLALSTPASSEGKSIQDAIFSLIISLVEGVQASVVDHDAAAVMDLAVVVGCAWDILQERLEKRAVLRNGGCDDDDDDDEPSMEDHMLDVLLGLITSHLHFPIHTTNNKTTKKAITKRNSEAVLAMVQVSACLRLLLSPHLSFDPLGRGEALLSALTLHISLRDPEDRAEAFVRAQLKQHLGTSTKLQECVANAIVFTVIDCFHNDGGDVVAADQQQHRVATAEKAVRHLVANFLPAHLFGPTAALLQSNVDSLVLGDAELLHVHRMVDKLFVCI